MKKNIVTLLLILIFIAIGLASLKAQSWDDGMYHIGRNMMDWRGSASLYTVTGKVIVDSSFSTTSYMNNMRPAFYYLDTVGNGSKNYQLFFGPYWYEPANGTLKPTDGQTVTIKGIKMTTIDPPMLSVYIIDGNLWRDTIGVEPWSGGWIHRTDTDSTNVFCPTDSISFMHLSPNSMGMGMMGGGMQWPDSIFAQFEEMIPDSIPNNLNNHSLIGFHLDIFNPSGQTMMQPGSMYNGTMGMQQPVKLVFHIPADSLSTRGITMSQVICRYMDNNGNWNNVSGQINSSNNTITISSSQLYSFYTIESSSATAVDKTKNELPEKYILEQNYPNPFNPSTTIKYSIPVGGLVTLKVYSIIGKEVRTLVSSEQSAGTHTVNFDASDLASGIYLYTLTANSFIQTKKLVLIK